MEPVLFIYGAIAVAAVAWPAWNRWRTRRVITVLTPVATSLGFQLGYTAGSKEPNSMRGTLDGVAVVVECPQIPVFERNDGRIDYRQGPWTLDLRTDPPMPLSAIVDSRARVNEHTVEYTSVHKTGDPNFDMSVLCAGDPGDILPLLHPSVRAALSALIDHGASIDHGNIVLPLKGALLSDSDALTHAIVDCVKWANVLAAHLRTPQPEMLAELAIEHPAPAVRNSAAALFVRQFPRHERRRDIVRTLLNDPDPTVTIWAISSADSECADNLVELINDSTRLPYVRAAALTAAADRAPEHPGLPDAARQARRLRERPLTIATLKVAAAIPMPEVAKWVDQSINDASPDVQAAAADVLASNHSPDLAIVRRRHLQHSVPAVVDRILTGISRFGTIEDVPHLTEALGTFTFASRESAAIRLVIAALQDKVGAQQVGAFAIVDGTQDSAGAIAIVE